MSLTGHRMAEILGNLNCFYWRDIQGLLRYKRYPRSAPNLILYDLPLLKTVSYKPSS